MNPMSLATKLYVTVVCAAAGAGLALLYYHDPLVPSEAVAAVSLLAGLAVVAELLAFLLPRGAHGSIAFIPYLAAVLVAPSWVTVGAVVAVDADGDIHDPDGGAIVAGARAPEGDWLGGYAALGVGVWPAGPGPEPQPGTNTTIAVVATDAPLDRSAAYRLAQCAHDGLARAIRPCHTPFDGDTIFALSTMPGSAGSITPRTLAILCAVAEQTLARAVLKAVGA